MNVPAIIIVAFLFVLVGLAVWRNIRKGAPCSCGKCDGCHCTCGGALGDRALPAGGSRSVAAVGGAGGPRSVAAVGGEGTSHAK